MSVHAIVYQRLIGRTALTALVGTRIFPDALKQDSAYPAVVYGVSSTEAVQATQERSYRVATVETMVLAETRLAALGAHKEIIAALDRFVGSSGGIVFLHCLLSNEVSGYDPPAAGTATGTFTESATFSIAYTGD